MLASRQLKCQGPATRQEIAQSLSVVVYLEVTCSAVVAAVVCRSAAQGSYVSYYKALLSEASYMTTNVSEYRYSTTRVSEFRYHRDKRKERKKILRFFCGARQVQTFKKFLSKRIQKKGYFKRYLNLGIFFENYWIPRGYFRNTFLRNNSTGGGIFKNMFYFFSENSKWLLFKDFSRTINSSPQKITFQIRHFLEYIFKDFLWGR